MTDASAARPDPHRRRRLRHVGSHLPRAVPRGEPRLLARRDRDRRPRAPGGGAGAASARSRRRHARRRVGGRRRTRSRRHRLAERHARRARRAPRSTRASTSSSTSRSRSRPTKGARSSPKAERARAPAHGVPEPALGRRLPHPARPHRARRARRRAPLRVALRVVEARAAGRRGRPRHRRRRAAASSTTSARTSSTRPCSCSGRSSTSTPRSLARPGAGRRRRRVRRAHARVRRHLAPLDERRRAAVRAAVPRARLGAPATRRWGLDVQEPALLAGALPGDPGFGETPEARWGVLGVDGSASPVPTERGDYGEFYRAPRPRAARRRAPARRPRRRRATCSS